MKILEKAAQIGNAQMRVQSSPIAGPPAWFERPRVGLGGNGPESCGFATDNYIDLDACQVWFDRGISPRR
jgi:hypothetical protein